MNEEIRTLEKVIEQLKRRVTAAAREPFDVNGRKVQINIQLNDQFTEVNVNDEYVGGLIVGHSYTEAVNLARIVAKTCDVGGNDYAIALDELMFRLDRAGA